MGSWNDTRPRRVIGEQAGPLQDQVMQGFNDQGFGGALAVQDGRVVGGNVGSRMPEDNIPRNRARVFFGGNQTDPNQGMTPEGRASAMSGDIVTNNAMQNVEGPYRDEHERRTAAMRHAAEPMRRFLDPSGSLVSANELTDKMRPAGMTNEDWATQQDVVRGERNKEKDFERQLKIIQSTPVSFGNGAGTANGQYMGPTPPPEQPQFFVVKPGETLTENGRKVFTADSLPQNEAGADWTWNNTGNGVINKRTGEVKTFPELQRMAEEAGLKDGQRVMINGQPYYWSSKYGFLDQTGAPVYEPPVKDQPFTFNDALALKFANENGLRPPPQQNRPGAPVRKPLGGKSANTADDPAAKWRVPVWGE